jgi:hypothetical protein
LKLLLGFQIFQNNLEKRQKSFCFYWLMIKI